MDITPLLKGEAQPDRGAYFYYRGTQLCAVRLGKYKAHFITQPAYGPDKPRPHDPPLLFDLENDPGESFDVAGQHADVVERISAATERHKAELKPLPTQLESILRK